MTTRYLLNLRLSQESNNVERIGEFKREVVVLVGRIAAYAWGDVVRWSTAASLDDKAAADHLNDQNFLL